MDAWSGLHSYEMIRAGFQGAIADPRIQGILLDVDSPRGEVGGLFDPAGEIFAGRWEEPPFSVSNYATFSTGYALASSAEGQLLAKPPNSLPADHHLGAPRWSQGLLDTPEVPFQHLPLVAKEGSGPSGADEDKAEVKEGSHEGVLRHVMFHHEEGSLRP